MSNFDYPITSDTQPANLDELNAVQSVPKARKTSKKFWIIFSLVCLILVCVAACITFAVVTLITSNNEKAPIQGVLDSYMVDMMNQDAESAFSLFDPRLSKKLELSKLKEFCQGNNYIIFDGYQRLEVDSLMMTKAFNTNPELPQGDVATIKATVYYSDGFVGQMNATMEKNNGIWTIYYVNVVVPPDKIGGMKPSM